MLSSSQFGRLTTQTPVPTIFPSLGTPLPQPGSLRVGHWANFNSPTRDLGAGWRAGGGGGPAPGKLDLTQGWSQVPGALGMQVRAALRPQLQGQEWTCQEERPVWEQGWEPSPGSRFRWTTLPLPHPTLSSFAHLLGWGSPCSLPRRCLSSEGLSPEPPLLLPTPACPSCRLAFILPVAAVRCMSPDRGGGQPPPQLWPSPGGLWAS